MGLVSKQCVNFVKGFEGFSATPYYDCVGVKTLGYGMTGSEIQGLSYVTEPQASQMLENLLNRKYAKPIKNDIDRKKVHLNQNQFDALTSMAYNVGIYGLLGSTLYRDICNGVRDRNRITNDFCMWCKAGGRTVSGLLRRRKEEANMFFGSGNTSSGSSFTISGQNKSGGKSYYNVKKVQAMLIKLGYPCGASGSDGLWGQGTINAVRCFQRDCNLTVEGIVGDNTYHKLEAEYNKKISSSKPTSNSKLKGNDLVRELQQEINKQGFGNISVDGIVGQNTIFHAPMCRQGARGNITKIIQKMLINLGYPVGSYGADGSFGSGTSNAVKCLQRDCGLAVDGIVGRGTWKALFENLK